VRFERDLNKGRRWEIQSSDKNIPETETAIEMPDRGLYLVGWCKEHQEGHYSWSVDPVRLKKREWLKKFSRLRSWRLCRPSKEYWVWLQMVWGVTAGFWAGSQYGVTYTLKGSLRHQRTEYGGGVGNKRSKEANLEAFVHYPGKRWWWVEQEG
jgi:hypothetical protein